MTMKKRALRADSGGRSVKIVSPLPEHQNDALNISSNAISHLGAEHRATRTTLVNSTHVSQADRREEAGNVKRILAGNEQEHQDAAHDQQSTIASSGNDYGPCPFADLSASALDPARTSSTQSTSHEPRNAASQKVIQKEMFFSFDAGNFDDGQNVPENPLAKGPTSTSVIGAVPITDSPTSVIGVVPMTDSQSLLCEDQQRVVDLVLQGLNVFYTGSAGTGKSTVLKAFVKRLKADDKKVHIIAPTNLAAQMIHGKIIWSYAGWTPNTIRKSQHALELACNGTLACNRFIQTDVPVIDEISMIEIHLFERLITLIKAARSQAGRPMKDIQIVVTGDVCKLSTYAGVC
jgi:hypothetical protein